MDYSGIGETPIAKAFLEEGISPFLPARLGPLPRAGRDGSHAYGHEVVSYFISLPRARVNIRLTGEVHALMGKWLKRFPIHIMGSWGVAPPGVRCPLERELGPIRRVGYWFSDGKFSGTLDAWVVDSGRTRAAFIIQLVESLCVTPRVTAEERRKFKKDWRLVFALPWENPRRR